MREVRGVSRVARHLEGEVRFHRNAQIDRPAGVVAPAALVQLLLQDVVGKPGNARVVFPAQPGQEQHVFGFENRVALEFANPVAVRLLQGKEEPIGSNDCVMKR